MTRTIQIDLAPIDHFHQDKADLDRRAQIVARQQAIYAFRNQLLSQKLGTVVSNEDVVRTEFGKPYLQAHPGFYFNHSHSKKMYALASSSRIQDLGVDIEEVDRPVRFDALAKHAFHANEYQRWKALDEDSAYWFKVWTTKEAVLKAHGMGIRMSLNELDTQVHALYQGGRCEHPQLGLFAYQNFEIQSCMCTVAWRSEQSCLGLAFPQIQIISHSSEDC